MIIYACFLPFAYVAHSQLIFIQQISTLVFKTKFGQDGPDRGADVLWQMVQGKIFPIRVLGRMDHDLPAHPAGYIDSDHVISLVAVGILVEQLGPRKDAKQDQVVDAQPGSAPRS